MLCNLHCAMQGEGMDVAEGARQTGWIECAFSSFASNWWFTTISWWLYTSAAGFKSEAFKSALGSMLSASNSSSSTNNTNAAAGGYTKASELCIALYSQQKYDVSIRCICSCVASSVGSHGRGSASLDLARTSLARESCSVLLHVKCAQHFHNTTAVGSCNNSSSMRNTKDTWQQQAVSTAAAAWC